MLNYQRVTNIHQAPFLATTWSPGHQERLAHLAPRSGTWWSTDSCRPPDLSRMNRSGQSRGKQGVLKIRPKKLRSAGHAVCVFPFLFKTKGDKWQGISLNQYISKFHIHIWGIAWQYGYWHLLGYTPSKPNVTQFEWAYVHALEFIYLNMHIVPIHMSHYQNVNCTFFCVRDHAHQFQSNPQVLQQIQVLNYPSKVDKEKRLLHVASRPSNDNTWHIPYYYDSNNHSVSYSVANWPTETNPSTTWKLFSRVT